MLYAFLKIWCAMGSQIVQMGQTSGTYCVSDPQDLQIRQKFWVSYCSNIFSFNVRADPNDSVMCMYYCVVAVLFYTSPGVHDLQVRV